MHHWRRLYAKTWLFQARLLSKKSAKVHHSVSYRGGQRRWACAGLREGDGAHPWTFLLLHGWHIKYTLCDPSLWATPQPLLVRISFLQLSLCYANVSHISIVPLNIFYSLEAHGSAVDVVSPKPNSSLFFTPLVKPSRFRISVTNVSFSPLAASDATASFSLHFITTGSTVD